MSAEKRREYSVEELLPRTGSVYKLVIIAAKRALEISDGSPKLVESSPKEKPALISLREIGEGRIGMKIKKNKDGEKS